MNGFCQSLIPDVGILVVDGFGREEFADVF